MDWRLLYLQVELLSLKLIDTEIAVKWFEMLQTGLPMNVLSAVVAPIRLSFSEQLELQVTIVPD